MNDLQNTWIYSKYPNLFYWKLSTEKKLKFFKKVIVVNTAIGPIRRKTQ